MIKFTTIIKKFASKGEKTGWSYIDIPADIAETLKPGNKKSFRVKGKLDNYVFENIGLLPMGDGEFIMALNGAVRKGIRKEKGATITVQIQPDNKEKSLSADFMECLAEEPKAIKFFKGLAKSHQRYFSNWIESAKTDATKTKRIAQSINALALSMGYGEMIRANTKKKLF